MQASSVNFVAMQSSMPTELALLSNSLTFLHDFAPSWR